MSVQRFRMKEILAELKRRGVLHGRRRPAGHGPGGLLRGPGRRHLHRRGRGDLAAVPRRVEAGAAPVPLRAGREDGHDARCRPRGSTCSRCGTTPSAASSSRAAARSSASSATSSSPSAAGPGSRPSAQVLAELDALRGPGDADRLHRRRQPDRQQEGDQGGPPRRRSPGRSEHGYPLTFFTEASIDLADDAELMELMVDANIIAVFIGIESPNEASLRETKKFQNVRAGRDDAREGPPHPGRRDGGLVRDDHRVRQRRRDDLRRPARVHPRGPDRASR